MQDTAQSPFVKYVYDDAARTVTVTDKAGLTTLVTLDALGRVVSQAFNADGVTLGYGYNEVGSVKTVNRNGEAQLEMTWDPSQRKLLETMHYPNPVAAKTVAYHYWANGLPRSFTGADDLAYEYVYDRERANRLERIAFPGPDPSLPWTIAYDPASYRWLRPTGVVLPGGGAREQYEYDELLRPTSIAARKVDDSFAGKIDYTAFFADGNVKSKAVDSVQVDYSYDALERLRGVHFTDAARNESYSYDWAGNPKTADGAPAGWEVRDDNELVRMTFQGDDAPTEYTYDVNGNVKSVTDNGRHERWRYDYDQRNNLVKAERLDYDDPGTVIKTATYAYDAFNRRISKEVDGLTTYFQYSEEGLVAEYDGAGQTIRTYGYEPGSLWGTRPLFQKVGTSYYWYLNDHLGTPQRLFDGAGTVVWSADYQAYGQATVTMQAVTNNLRLPGQYYDYETGLHYNWNRTYDPRLGRYLSTDPIGIRGGLNLYAYVTNDPINLVDPRGLDWFRPKDDPYVVGRAEKGSPVVPGKGIGKFIDDYVPAGHTFGTLHDDLVDMAHMAVVPDPLANVPTMLGVYLIAVYVELDNSIKGLLGYQKPYACH